MAEPPAIDPVDSVTERSKSSQATEFLDAYL